MAIEVQTTQNVTIDYEPAGIGYRLLAYIVDWVVIGVWILAWVGAFLYFDLDGVLKSSFFDSFPIFLYYMIGIPIVFYDLLFEIFNNGQSVGKAVCRIRVVNIDGTAPSVGAYLIRWLFRLVDFTLSEGMLAIIMIVATKNSQRLGDLLAGTTVVDLKVNAQNKELKLSDLDFKEDYKVTYIDVLDRLSDRDIQTIRSIIEDEKMKDNVHFNQRLTDKVKIITGYTYEGSNTAFLKKIVSDYNYLALQ